jgi:Transposase Tn5 dimerisation domain/Transposase DNA-binding
VFRDYRHGLRLQSLLKSLSAHPGKSVPEALGSASQSQAAYRFWSNSQVKASQIIASQRGAVVQRIKAAGNVVLAVQDTTDLNYGTNRRQTMGLGFINKTVQQGIKVHSCLAVSGDGLVLGLLGQQTWTRPERTGKRADYKQKPTSEKESQRWLDTMKAAQVGLSDGPMVVHVGDREADMYDFFVQAQQLETEVLIRAVQNRKVRHELAYLLPTIAQAPILGERTIELQRRPERPAREAKIQLRAMKVTLEVPAQHPRRKDIQPVTMNVLLVEEVNPPTGETPIHWLLLTTLPIDTAAQAWQCVTWYTYRWLIERFHYVLKEGCKVEALQLAKANRLCKALATYSIVACRILTLMETARQQPDQSCETILTPPEWRLLRRKFQPKSRTSKPPALAQATIWIAQLGGFLARKGDGMPGVKTLWRGISKLHDLLEGAQLAPKT